jgi:hypothetical protein
LKVLLIFNIISGLIPSAGLPTFFFLNDVVKMSPFQITMLHIIGEFTELLVFALFQCFFLNISIRTIYGVVCVFKVLSGILPYFLVAHASSDYPHLCHHDLNNTLLNTSCYYFEEKNLDPFPLALGDNVIGEALDELQAIPLAIVTKTVCFHVLGATVFTFTLALQNSVSAVRAYIDSSMLGLFEIDHGHFVALPEYVKFCSILDGVTLCFVGLLPNLSTKEIRVAVETQRMATEIVEEINIDPEIDEIKTTNSITPLTGPAGTQTLSSLKAAHVDVAFI